MSYQLHLQAVFSRQRIEVPYAPDPVPQPTPTVALSPPRKYPKPKLHLVASEEWLARDRLDEALDMMYIDQVRRCGDPHDPT